MTCGASCYVSIGRVKARKLDEDLRWRTEDGSRLQAKAGDWVLTDADDPSAGLWTVGHSVFSATYEEVGPGTYRKTVHVRAVRLEKDAIVETLEGEVSTPAGDWLVTNPTGESWPVTTEEFARRYREMSARDSPEIEASFCD